jgi:hypothetical protein
MTDDTTDPSTVRRRSILKATAWSAPVVALAAATPWASASPTTGYCSVDYQLAQGSQYTALVTNISASTQVVVLAVQSTNTITAILVEDDNAGVMLYAPTTTDVLNGLAVSFTRDSDTTGTITLAVPAGAAYTVMPDVSFPPNSGTATFTPSDGGCSPVSVVVSSA